MATVQEVFFKSQYSIASIFLTSPGNVKDEPQDQPCDDPPKLNIFFTYLKITYSTANGILIPTHFETAVEILVVAGHREEDPVCTPQNTFIYPIMRKTQACPVVVKNHLNCT